MVTTGQGGFVVSGKSIVCKTDVLLPLLVVPGAGVEPAHPFGHWCLRPTRLPIPPSGLMRAGEHWTAKIRKIIHTPSGKWENRRVKGRGSRRFAYLCGQWRE